MSNILLEEVKNHWTQLRSMSYDLLDVLLEEDLTKKLPFPESQTLGYQFYCMIGAQESNIPYITEGDWLGFTCSLDYEEDLNKETIREAMEIADGQLFRALESIDLLKKFKGGTTPLTNYMILVEHEAQHQGQLINFIYALDLPLPKSWEQKWALKK